MRVFLDTSILVAAVLQPHAQHRAARTALARVRDGHDIGHASVHTLAETFAVLTRMPTKPKLTPADVQDILQKNFLPHVGFVPMPLDDYVQAIRLLATRNLAGGKIFDVLHLQAARRVAAECIYTLNLSEWRNLAPDLAAIIRLPPAP